tara:strand:- start:186 stop:374 length:189 start_codon:yes stop_codon:yes gene_type:complete
MSIDNEATEIIQKTFENMNNEKTITIPLWEYKFLNQLKKDLIIDMKIEELKREENIKKAMEV